MRMRSIAVAVGIVAVAAFSPSMVSAAPLTPIVINAHPCDFTLAENGTWEASGAINDSGTYVRTELASSPPGRAFGVPGPFREAFVFTSARGTFTIEAEEKVPGPTGVWQLSSGTGAFASASGHGDGIAFFPDPTVNSCSSGFQFTYQLTGIASTA